MGQVIQEFKNFFRKGDMILLLLCLVTTAFGVLVIASATNYMGEARFRYLAIQVLAAAAGVLLYAIISSIDVEFFSEHRVALVVINCFLLLLLIPFGVEVNGNKSWIRLPFLPFNIQVAEVCKITYVLIMASVMASHQNKISSVKSVFHMAFHLILLFGLSVALSRDWGVSLIFVFIFAGMAYSGGVNLIWFLLAAVAVVAAWPFAWNYLMGDYMKARIEILYNPDLDAAGTGPRYHTNQSLKSLTGGGLTGQGLFNGTRTQDADSHLFAQHTDYIFSAIGEELGFLGCLLVVVLLALIIARCIYVGTRSQDFMRRLVCFGSAAALIFQVVINVGMCIGVMPVIGLTLPFVSYGGSSILTLYAMLGLVSGVHARPAPTSHERYIRLH